jgi:hypothetical protein
MPRTRPQFRLFDLLMWVVLCALILGFARAIWQIPQQTDSFGGSAIFVCIAFGIWFVLWSTVRARRTGPICQECGRRFWADGQLANSTLCARCRPASLPRVQARREQLVGWLALLFSITIVTALIGLPFWNALVAKVGPFSWILYPLLALGAALSFLAAVIAVLAVIFIIRNWRLRFEKPTLALARKSARDEGTIARTGPLTIWWSGPTDPVPLVTEQMETVRRRFEHLIDEPVDTPPLRLLIFSERRAFAAYHRNIVSEKGIYDCLYVPRPTRALTLSTEVPRFRMVDPARSLRSGFVLYLLETYKGFAPSPWLQSGISTLLASDSGGDAREQINRRMKVAIASGANLNAAQFFSNPSALQMREQMGPLVDHSPFARVWQFKGQSCSVLEYLAGSDSPPDRLGRFRSLLSDLKPTGSQEAVFERHFGHGFAALLEQWQSWVLEQGPGNDPIPPPEVRAAIIDRLVPAIVDRSKKAHDRIVAMRSLGSAGYVVGAGTLIDVLREGDDRFTQTATWALESISGLAWGADPDRWSDWWSTRDPQALGALELTERPRSITAIAPP